MRRCILVIAMAGILSAMLPPGRALAHPILMTYINHRVALSVGPENIDIHVELLFYEFCSMSERRRIDSNHDDAISRDELNAYRDVLVESVCDDMALSIGGHDVELMPLYVPEVDLMGVEQVAPSHHVLKLSFFARTPPGLACGSEIVLTDGLWANAPSLCSLSVTRDGGFRLSIPDPESGESAPGESVHRRLRARVEGVPQGWPPLPQPPVVKPLQENRAAAGAIPEHPGLPWALVSTFSVLAAAAWGLRCRALPRRSQENQR